MVSVESFYTSHCLVWSIVVVRPERGYRISLEKCNGKCSTRRNEIRSGKYDYQ